MPDKIISEPSFPAVIIILSFRLALLSAKWAHPAALERTVDAAETAQERVSRSLPRNPENVRAERASAGADRGAPACATREGCAYDERVLREPAAATPLLAARFPQA